MIGAHAAEAARVDQRLALRVGDVRVGHPLGVVLAARGGHDAPDRQPELARELEVALVVRGHGHDGAGPVGGQHVVRDPDGDPLAVDRVDRLRADRHPGLLALGRQALDLGLPAGLVDVGVDVGLAVGRGQLLDQRMLGRQDHEGRPEQRVRPCREDADLVTARLVVVGRDREDDLGALRAADPVRLHQADRLGPVDLAEVQQLVGVAGQPQEPLLQVTLDDRRPAPPADAVGALDLFARQHDLVLRAPVDGRHRAVGQPGLEELQEQPLVPAVVLGIAGDDLGIPVEGRAHRLELARLLLDIAHRPLTGMDAGADRGVLGGQAERVEADRQEDVVAVHAPEAAVGVRRRDDVPVTDMQVARRVGIHRQQVELAPRRVVQVGPVEAHLLPLRLPAGLDLRRVVTIDAVTLAACPGRACRRGGFGRRLLFSGRGHRPPLPPLETEPPAGPVGGGGATGIRTPDLLNAIQTLFQLSYSPVDWCSTALVGVRRAFYRVARVTHSGVGGASGP